MAAFSGAKTAPSRWPMKTPAGIEKESNHGFQTYASARRLSDFQSWNSRLSQSPDPEAKNEPGTTAVVDPSDMSDCFRGDNFEPALRAAIDWLDANNPEMLYR